MFRFFRRFTSLSIHISTLLDTQRLYVSGNSLRAHSTMRMYVSCGDR